MAALIDVVFQNGVFRPLHPVHLAEGSRGTVYPLDVTEEAATIAHTPGICGGRARLAGTRITVWGLVEHRRNRLDDAAILAAVPGLTPAQLAAAWAYADEHPEEIETDLQANDE